MEQKVITAKFAPGDILEVFPSPGFDNGGVAKVIDLDKTSERIPSYFVCPLEDIGFLSRSKPGDMGALMNCSRWVKQENLRLLTFRKPSSFDKLKVFGPWIIFLGLGFAASYLIP